MNNNDWLDINVLEDYLDGKLDAKAMYRVERLSLEDPFVAEALAGLSASPRRGHSLSLLQKQLQDRVAQKPVEQKRWQITTQRLSIAAAAAVLFITVSLLFWMKENKSREQLAGNNPKKVEVEIAATKEANPSAVKPKAEVEKVIVEAKNAAYATNSKGVGQKLQKSAVPEISRANSSSLENKSEEISLQAIEIEQKNARVSKRLSSALAGKVAGSASSHKHSIRGTVYGNDKTPIPGASVRLMGAAQSTLTDGNGQFNLTLDTTLKNPQLNVASLGFMPKQVDVKKDENLSIELKQKSSALNEVVITATEASREAHHLPLMRVEPVGGWDKFEEYARNNNKLLIGKKLTGRFVTVFFDLDKEGNAINLRTIKKYNMIPVQTEAEENEAIRLVKNGPKWVLPPPNSVSIRNVDIKF